MARAPRILRPFVGSPAGAPDQPSVGEIMSAAERLRAGGLVAFPTETVYGLGADAFNPRAVDAVFTAKGRPSHNPLIVHVSGPDMAQALVADWTPAADALARRFWPGPLTLVLPRSRSVLDAVTAGGPTVAVRSPDHPTAIALLFAFGGPLVGPSANRSGGVSPTCAAHVRAGFDSSEVTVLDGGTCPTGIESTVLSLATPAAPEVLRPGVIGPAELSRCLGVTVRIAAMTSQPNGPLMSPGMLESHY
ncbi:MAG: L-threonylcarbamoyladenylate synthase, partial [Phycisphaerales bacterium]